MTPSPAIPIIIDSLDDPRVSPYRNLTDRELATGTDLFIAEGEHVVRRFLASDFPKQSVLIAEKHTEKIAPLVPPGVPLYAAPEAVVSAIVGFKFHSGIIACGQRKPRQTPHELLAHHRTLAQLNGDPPTPLTLLICPEVINVDNLGSIIRIAAGFGVDALILGERSCDPFWRRAVRVSMGTVFSIPLLHCDDLQRDLLVLKNEFGVKLDATVIDDSAVPIHDADRPARLGIMLGSESQGLHRRWLALADRSVTIKMHHGTDSLNIAMAGAIFLYHYTRPPGSPGSPRV
jgi:tRNA G18 (ribose-2'-O)-methylase SpoU